MSDDVNAPADGGQGAEPLVSDTAAPVDGGAAPVAQAAPAKTLADDGDAPAPEGTEQPKPTWPEDWREKFANGDEKMLARLKRFTHPENVVKSWRELEAKMSSGEVKKQLAPDAKPEEIAAWRKENGIPEAPDKYEFDLKGYIPPEQDKPILDEFKAFAHAKNLTPKEASEFAAFYYAQQERALAEMGQRDNATKIESTVELRAEWGPEYKANFNAIQNYLDATTPPGFKEMFLSARLPDGTRLGDNVMALKWLAQEARDKSPGAELMPSGTANIQKGVEDRIAEIDRMQQSFDGQREYWTNPALQKEYADLIAARDSRNRRAA